METSKLFLLAFAVLCVDFTAGQGSFRLANIYSDQMVLQMAPKSTQIWGYGNPSSTVTVQLDSQAQLQTTVTADGRWSVRLSPQQAGGPFTLQATQGPSEQLSITVWFGDVWVCSGQSNMEMSIAQMVDSAGETLKALSYPNLRLMKVARTFSNIEQDDLLAIGYNWAPTSLSNVPNFSALCLMYAERLSDALGNSRPIGLIDASWGGTPIEAWSSSRVTTFCNTPAYVNSTDHNADHALWNAMINPLTKMAVRGAIWYQGESNTGKNRDYYPCNLQRIVDDWKTAFVDGNVAVQGENNLAFPFGVAQIGPYSAGGDFTWGELRWHQSVDLGNLPNIFIPEGFMAVTYDTTDPDSPTGDIHPRDKMTVADRLANAARSFLYGEQNLLMNGPSPVSFTTSEPGMATIAYDMDIKVAGTQGFTAKLSDNSWVEAMITGVTGREVRVSFDPTATHVAYAWQGVVCDYKACSIYSTGEQLLPANVWLWKV